MSPEIALTAEQEAVVTHPAIPLRVEAGAGTGKTTTIALRLAAHVAAGIEPEATLGVTFTNKAAEELADRLRVELPEFTRDGRGVEVTTYHGFAHALLQEFGVYVGIERETPVIGPGYQRQLLHESLTTQTYRYLDMTHPPTRVAEAAGLGRQLGDNLLTPSDLAAASHDGDDPVTATRKELIGILGSYDEAKRRLGVVDYADLIRLAHQLVADYPVVASWVRERYRMVLLDEYQDTDPGQRLLLQTLFGDGFAVTAVGDPDQTIFEWRGASLHNFASFPDDFPQPDGSPAATLPLTLNRRSDRLILDVANEIRKEIHPDGAFEPLVAVPGAGEGEIETAWLHSDDQEAAWIADRVLSLHDDDEVPWREIAVLFRKNRSIRVVHDALVASGAPVEVVSLGGLLGVPEVVDLRAWLRVLHEPEDSAALARILFGGRYRLGLGDLAPLGIWVRSQASPTASDEEVAWPLLEAIDRMDEVEGLSSEASTRLLEFRGVYRDLLVEAQGVSLVELCRRILDRMDAWREVDALPANAALSARLNLYRFLDLAEEWSPLEGRPSLRAFLGYLDLLEDEAAAEELDTATVSHEDAVSLLTVHRAKGLEWDVVVLPALTKGTFPVESAPFDDPVNSARYLPYDLRIDREALPDIDNAPSEEARKQLLRDHHMAQEWRAAYVAVTRARHRLVMSGAWWGRGKRAREHSPLFEIGAAIGVGRVNADRGERPPNSAPEGATPAPDPLFPEGWQVALREAASGRLELGPAAARVADQLRLQLRNLPSAPEPPPPPPFQTSVTGLVTLAGCPRRFFWSEIDRLPRRPSSAQRRGTEFHRRAELHNLGVVPLDEMSDDLYDVPVTGDAPGAGAGDPYEVFLGSRFAADRPRFVEVPFDISIGGARIRGRIDAVYVTAPRSWEIVDYKSGGPSSDEARIVQLQAYAVAAADGAVGTDTPDRLLVTFAYFGGGRVTEETTVADPAWIDAARDHMKQLITRATGDSFSTRPSSACRSCDFLPFCEDGQAFVARSTT